MKKTEHYPKAEVFETIMDHIKEVAAIREYYEVGAISMDTFIEKYYQADSEMLGWQQVTIALELKDQRGFTLPPFIKS